MSRRRFAAFLAGLTLPVVQGLYPGCATMLNGPCQRVVAESKPRGPRASRAGKRG
jgi:hypothetical protein